MFDNNVLSKQQISKKMDRFIIRQTLVALFLAAVWFTFFHLIEGGDAVTSRASIEGVMLLMVILIPIGGFFVLLDIACCFYVKRSPFIDKEESVAQIVGGLSDVVKGSSHEDSFKQYMASVIRNRGGIFFTESELIYLSHSLEKLLKSKHIDKFKALEKGLGKGVMGNV